MTHADDPKRKKLTRPRMSDADGTREGGLVFCIVFLCGFVAASFAHPAALTSFWVWCGLLSMTIGVSVAVQKLAAHFYGEDGGAQVELYHHNGQGGDAT